MLRNPAAIIKGIDINPKRASLHSNMNAIMNDETIVVIFFISIANEIVERLFTS